MICLGNLIRAIGIGQTSQALNNFSNRLCKIAAAISTAKNSRNISKKKLQSQQSLTRINSLNTVKMS